MNAKTKYRTDGDSQAPDTIDTYDGTPPPPDQPPTT
jgi:hypothetical protein